MMNPITPATTGVPLAPSRLQRLQAVIPVNMRLGCFVSER
jgi:hypothetical protein